VDHALLDLPGLLTRCAGERALARSLLEAFLEDLPERLGTFAGPEERGDLPGLAEAAHSLKGSSLTLGAVGVSALAAALEERARAGDRGEALRLLRGLRAAAGKTLEAVRRALGQDGESPVV
jgi:HPt (histidine-containing phosphotransfer) domain-containing protein